MNIYIVRHCKAEGQPAESPLTDVGKKQAEELASFFADKSIDTIVSSPFRRARQSIEPTAIKLGIQLKLDDRLSERVLCSESTEDWKQKLRGSFNELDLKLAGGESSREAMSRAVEVVGDLRTSGVENTILVTHGNLMTLLLKHFNDRFGYDEWEQLKNPDVFLLTINNHEHNLTRVWE
ncbi:histidine phosphatase family protein [Pseudalkalibacillus berkeleyi]|uniref:Phosphoglycerate mutase family protein n=1 Tax=Pseudalkalibacillus berkeleyi TaxID=1069813 RepID=A0ABS9GY83_9BACL|nr:histidine phosphatase family protein [Pseudalkalibacillus berkeleyi]MCF6136463.1 phosphoglycerate mutase family protein [Pseudalkalibacillus berkeleyi]